ncbi:hypothetical protein OUZ56_014674 [Daphnia magna]|uniref:Uncharacterized protein n=1 Tax=Daphnia magna TaxID=35525 RepID=A0ABR0AKG8_9CRUS|nr:hypothetical protein OUZ56_014674 [Daphnia magna]
MYCNRKLLLLFHSDGLRTSNIVGVQQQKNPPRPTNFVCPSHLKDVTDDRHHHQLSQESKESREDD